MTDHAAVAQAMAAGVGGWVLSQLGVDEQQLTASLIACSLGALFTPPVSRRRAAWLFLAAVCATAMVASIAGPLLATLLARWWPTLSHANAGKLVALVFGIWLYPLIQAVAAAVPRLVDRAVKGREGAKEQGR